MAKNVNRGLTLTLVFSERVRSDPYFVMQISLCTYLCVFVSYVSMPPSPTTGDERHCEFRSSGRPAVNTHFA